jgi:phytoene dehydrogenase-like protein
VALDAVVVGAGPNGLAAAIELARNGLGVHVVEASATPGGAARTGPLTLPGFEHDLGSAVHPLGVGSPFFSSLPLEEHGLHWVHPEAPVVHVLDGGRAVCLERSMDLTAHRLGPDGPRYRRLVEPFVRSWPAFVDYVLGPPLRLPRDPALIGRFGLRALRTTPAIARGFRTEEARALLGGTAAHSGLPLDRVPAAAVGLVLMIAGHAVGWPAPRGGAGALTRALASYLESLGGTIETGRRVASLGELPEARATLLALTSRQVADIAGDRLPSRYRSKLSAWEYGPGAYKVDWALSGPIPWSAADATRATTVHVGGTLEEIAEAERAPWRGECAQRPFVLLTQPTVADPSRAPDGRHTAWAYTHVPNGWTGDATEVIEAQVERFAPGFRELILARAVHRPRDLEAWNANLVGGDVNGGALTIAKLVGPLRQAMNPWSTPVPNLYVCSASTPPGGGVHGMCGYWGARSALAGTFG